MGFLNLGVFLVQLANLAVILYLIHRLLLKPYLVHIDEEARKRTELESERTRIQAIREDAESERKGIIDQANREAIEIRARAENIAHREAETIITSAKDEASMIKQRATNDLENERQAMHEALRSKILAIAIRWNEKLFGKNEANVAFLREEEKHFHF